MKNNKMIDRKKRGEIYHIGDSDEISIDQLVRYVGDIFKYTGTYEIAPTYAGSVARRCPKENA